MFINNLFCCGFNINFYKITMDTETRKYCLTFDCELMIEEGKMLEALEAGYDLGRFKKTFVVKAENIVLAASKTQQIQKKIKDMLDFPKHIIFFVSINCVSIEEIKYIEEYIG
jgi:hypothetical protein